MSSSSASPEPSGSRTKKSITKSKSRKKTDARSPKEADPSWPYHPPAGMTLLNEAQDAKDFDWDAVDEDSDTEIWIIRAPNSVKPKYLEELDLSVPSSTTHTTHGGQLRRKHMNYDVWCIGDEEKDDDPPIGGEELKTLSCLLPQKNGDLVLSSRPIARRLLLKAQDVKPTRPEAPVILQNPPRHSYTKEHYTHNFQPTGSLGDAGEDDMDVDETEVTAKKPKKSKGSVESPEKTIGKKRKGEADEGIEPKSSKKTKKAKKA